MQKTHVFHRSTRADYPVAVAGEGAYLIDAAGRRYLDASGGAAVSCLGHSDQAVRRAIHDQVDALAYAHSGFFTTEPMERLAARLAERAPGDLNRVYFVSGGSEAMEAAIKMARQYFLEVGQPDRRHVIARRQSYHGNTLGALAVGGNEWRRGQFAPLLMKVEHVAPCYYYRDAAPGETPEAYGLRVAGELEERILALGPGSVAAFVAEPVVGATAGALAPVPGYFRRIREICDRYGVLLILDEVMCGMGRTGTLFACEQDGVAPDLMAVAKGLGAGYQPIGATLVSEPVYQAFARGSGFFQHGHTYMGHATACAAANAVLDRVDGDNLLANVRAIGERLELALRDGLGQHAHVGDIRGRGLFLGVELVEDRETRQPFAPEARLHARIKANALAEGLMVYPMGGTIDGRNGDHVLLAPPFIIGETEVAAIVSGLKRAIDRAVAEVRA